MKSLSAGLATHLQGTTTTLATCWKIRRQDGETFTFTDHDVSLPVDIGDGDGVQAYLASASYNRTAIRNNDTLSVDNLDVVGVLSSSEIDEDELKLGLFDFAEVRVFVVDHASLADGILRMRRGWLGETTVTESGYFRAELRGLTQAFSRGIGELYSAQCRADLGDERCKVPISPAAVARSTDYAVGDYVVVTAVTLDRIFQCTTAGTTDALEPTYDTTVGATTTDGTAVFTAEEAWTRSIEVVAVDTNSPRKTFTVSELTPNSGGTTAGRDFFPDDSMNGGAITWVTGNNAGRSMEVRDFIADDAVTIEQTIELFLDMPRDIAVGDTATIYRGCFKRMLLDCRDIFNNIENFRGEHYVPGPDSLTDYPDARA